MERQIEAEVEVRAAVPWVGRVLVDALEVVVGPRAPGRSGAFLGEIPLDLHAGSSVRQQVAVTLAPVEGAADGGFAFALGWHPTGRGRLLPAFAGVLEGWASRGGTTLRLSGNYHAPLGYAGALGDAVVGKRVARAGLAAFLAGMAERVDAEIDRRLAAGPLPAEYAPDLRPREPAESWLG
jgi:hypothetical protein